MCVGNLVVPSASCVTLDNSLCLHRTVSSLQNMAHGTVVWIRKLIFSINSRVLGISSSEVNVGEES